MAGVGPVRRSQLIAPFGVGSIVIMRGGMNLIAAGLDHWYERESTLAAASADVDSSEFHLHEPRLERLLKVDHFRLPPDYRGDDGSSTDDVLNARLTVPFLRFPQWHVCPKCGRMRFLELYDRKQAYCTYCREAGQRVALQQARFIAMCEHGHIQDFPWNEWVHRSSHPACDGRNLRLVRSSGASLSAVRVFCDDCAQSRSLARITSLSKTGGTVLSEELGDSDQPYLCPGRSVWLGSNKPEGCGAQLRGGLPGAANIYYPYVESSIYVPVASGKLNEFLDRVKTEPELAMIFELAELKNDGILTVQGIREASRGFLHDYDDALLQSAVDALSGQSVAQEADAADRVGFRYQEYAVLRESKSTAEILSRRQDVESYETPVGGSMARVCLVDRLQETRALVGFSRVVPSAGVELEAKKRLLRRSLRHGEREWLPAYTVFGEGIYLELDGKALSDWESQPEVVKRVAPLVERNEQLKSAHRARPEDITPRFVLIHTLAHLLMNQLVFDCGYSSASLSERLYVSNSPDREMAAVLLYTAAGDSEGTLGGLVRMGMAGRLEAVLARALNAATWCSADPVCMELGYEIGQGPDGCNLAACHSCSLVPETACEEFNKYLDRGLVVGTPENPELGFFQFAQWAVHD